MVIRFAYKRPCRERGVARLILDWCSAMATCAPVLAVEGDGQCIKQSPICLQALLISIENDLFKTISAKDKCNVQVHLSKLAFTKDRGIPFRITHRLLAKRGLRRDFFKPFLDKLKDMLSDNSDYKAVANRVGSTEKALDNLLQAIESSAGK